MGKPSKSTRRHDLDWLRVLAVLFLFTFHTARIFDVGEAFYVQSDALSAPLTHFFVNAFNPWHMQLFFLLAGAASFFALDFRSSGRYLGERVRRLLIPLISSLVLLLPVQGYYTKLHNSGYAGSFLGYYPTFFRFDWNDLAGYASGWFTPGHLWFILFLLVLSLVALPIFAYLKREPGRQLAIRLADMLTKPVPFLLLGLPAFIALYLPDLGGKNPFYYLGFLLYGFLLMSDTRYGRTLDQLKGVALLLATLNLVANLFFWFTEVRIQLDLARQLYWHFTYSFGSWFWLIAILGYGQKHLNRQYPWLRYASEAAYPAYLLHQPVVVMVGYYIIQWQASPWLKFVTITLLSFTVTLLIYELVVKRFNLTRSLFGMKSHPKQVPAERDKVLSTP